MLITWVFSLKSDQTKNLKATYRRVQTLINSLKYCKRVAPEVQISGQNSKFLGLYSVIFAPINVKFGTGERDGPRTKFHIYRGNVSPLLGEKPILDH